MHEHMYMIKFWVSIFSCLALLFLSSCKDENNLLIKGEISNIEEPYILATSLVNDSLRVDTIQTSKHGKFKYSTNIDTLTSFTLYFNDFESSAVIYADKEQVINVSGDANMPDLMQVHGNEINEDLSAFKKKNEALLKTRAELLLNIKIDNKNNTNNGVLTKNEKVAHINSLNHELTQKAELYIQENSEKKASVVLINDFFKNTENPQALERVLGYLKGDALNFKLTNNLNIYSNDIKKSAENSIMPYFMLVDTKNDTIFSYNLRGKYTVLSFLSANGTESRENIKVLKEEYTKLNKDSVEFISIYIDSDLYPITTISEDSIPWPTVPEKKSWASEVADAYNIKYVPYNIFISPEGVIKRRNIPAQDINQAIKEASREKS